MFDVRTVESGACCDQERDSGDSAMSMTARRRRAFQRQACLLSVLAAFSLGLALGVFVPLIGISQAATKGAIVVDGQGSSQVMEPQPTLQTLHHPAHQMPHFPTIDDIRSDDGPRGRYASVSFIAEEKLGADGEVIFHPKLDPDSLIDRKLPSPAASIVEQMLAGSAKVPSAPVLERRESRASKLEELSREDVEGVIRDGIFWGASVERALPVGFDRRQSESWARYLREAEVERLEIGCGRMQNRLLVFRDGTRACARYRQNTDQIQGELFSFYLGQLLNLTNLAPSAASIIDPEARLWAAATEELAGAQWKPTKPVVITKWIGNLEPAGIPHPFRPLERHLNRFDVRNITEGLDRPRDGVRRLLLDRLGTARDIPAGTGATPSATGPLPSQPPTPEVLERLVELAQWSDLIVFDYLIANLDRVVNNLYNFQWNADIMAAPAHNLARQTDSALLVFLDNESGLLHGYRLLKKYEAYHGLLLDNLCVFRRSTVQALEALRDASVGQRLNALFERTTTAQIRDVLPPLPEKSVKILVDRIDRVLGQVQKCRETFAISR
ncbi:extracellular serine/threonine protein kinase four-jointed [Anopheles funestus]|uniref:extracellular serine/threonine protein kinase four-jointed n=1 Tax=Anopheles funestus TaxID=62324 RepID=UPI0020C62125|nr:extracellular serine/threonine protein kinase four-jointed [Anopheles funestus]XP_049286984.1 extracellular serine/threonine protein kinase four-jointed [Anopheles funestus]